MDNEKVQHMLHSLIFQNLSEALRKNLSLGFTSTIKDFIVLVNILCKNIKKNANRIIYTTHLRCAQKNKRLKCVYHNNR